MNIFSKEALDEKLRPNADRNYISRMQILSDNQKELTYSVFKDTGRLIQIERFMKNYPDKDVHVDATDVIVYIGGYNIQILKSGKHYIEHEDGFISDDFKEIEKTLYKFAQKRNI